DTSAVLYGQSAGFVNAIRPASDVVRTVSEDAERILRSRPRAILA
ncbi:MAG: nitronate monooxygenase, partial [Solirubrobacteraceae bacterium]|nr:nitronate monooxygenase [Solirubrobacteraceae bacterium]